MGAMSACAPISGSVAISNKWVINRQKIYTGTVSYFLLCTSRIAGCFSV